MGSKGFWRSDVEIEVGARDASATASVYSALGLVDPAHRGAHIAGSALGLPVDVVVVMCAPKVLRIQWVIWAGFANVRSAFRSSLSAKPALIVLSMLALYSRS
jgi:hypothetical protein